MKKHALLYICSLFIVTVSAIMPTHAQRSKEQFALYNYRNDGNFNAWLNIDIDSITYSCIDTLGVEHDAVVVQEVWTPDGLYRIPIEAIDSIGFRAPEPEMREGLFYLRDYHAAHTLAIDSLTLFFDMDIHRDSLPAVGQVVLHGMFTHPYEEGFAGRVKSINQVDRRIKVDCDMICVGDVYKHLVLVGSARTETETANARSYADVEPWMKYEDSDEIPIDTLGNLTFKVFDGLFTISSKNPSLLVKYLVYVDEDIYHMSANAILTHSDLQFSVNLSLAKLLSIGDSVKADKEAKDIADALLRLQNYKSMSEEKWIESILNEKIDKGNKEKLSAEESTVLEGLWEKLHQSWTIPIGGPFVLDLELGPLFKPMGDIEFGATWKTTARNTFYVEAKGWTMATLTNPVVALSTGAAEVNGSSSFHMDPIKSMDISLKAKGSLSMGVVGKASLSLIHKSVVHATVSVQGGVKLSGAFEAKWSSETPKEDLELYDVLKDSKIKAEMFANAGVNLGITPWSFLSADAEWEFCQSELGSCYLFPHFTEPALPTYDFEKKQWSNAGSNHFVLTCYPSKNFPEWIFSPCHVGMRIVDKKGKVIKENIEKESYYNGGIMWNIAPMQIDLSGLEVGDTLRCYPMFSYRNWKYLRATPSYEFVVPSPVNLGYTKKLTMKKGETRTLRIHGGWGLYEAKSSNSKMLKTTVHNDRLLSSIDIEAILDGATDIQVIDMYSGDEVTLPVEISDDAVIPSTISVSSSVIDFGYVPVGSSKTENFIVSNTGTSSLTFTVSELHNEFDIPESGKEFTLAAGEQKSFSVTFSSSTVNQSFGSLVRIFSDAENGTQYLELKGQTYPLIPDDNTPAEAIDLGLPSGTKWASYNLGATKPEGFGGYYAWGELKEKDVYSASTYQYCDGTEESCHNLGNSICGTKYDVATAKWGDGWQMPSHKQFEELISNCTQTTTRVNGIKGVRFTASNGNSIFIPAAGERFGDESDGMNDYGDYFTGTQYPGNMSVAYGFYFGYDGRGYEKKWNGHSIRPVYIEKDVPAEAIDLGLPSGTEWASYNLGATKPEEFGGYYAWGELKEKDVYSASTYQHCDGTEESCHNLGNNICGTKYDVATAKWGDGWQMPSHKQFEELISNCTQTATTLNGIKGVRFTASNGNSIFIPAAGECFGEDSDGMNDYGDYFTGTQYPGNMSVAYGFYFGYDGWGYEKKWNGHSIRPVYVEKKNDVPAEAIDLGLPSGTLWASCNVGATKPEEYGGYYAWGETVPKSIYEWSTYVHCDGSEETCHDIGDNISGTQYDAANILWGNNWELPTIEDWKELVQYCSTKIERRNGASVRVFTGSNGNSIELPIVRDGYWSGDIMEMTGAHFYSIDDNVTTLGIKRYWPLAIRPVKRN